MKRVAAAAILLALILTLACWSLRDLTRNIGELDDACDLAREASMTESDEALAQRGRALLDLWNEKEARFVLYIQHDNLDHLTQEFASLAGMAQYGDRAGFASALDSILSLLDDIRHSAIPSYRNLL